MELQKTTIGNSINSPIGKRRMKSLGHRASPCFGYLVQRCYPTMPRLLFIYAHKLPSTGRASSDICLKFELRKKFKFPIFMQFSISSPQQANYLPLERLVSSMSYLQKLVTCHPAMFHPMVSFLMPCGPVSRNNPNYRINQSVVMAVAHFQQVILSHRLSDMELCFSSRIGLEKSGN